MRENIRKLAVFVIVGAIALFIPVAMASAGDIQGRKSIQGQYYFVGGGPCLLALTGFTDTLQPNPPATAEGPWALSDNTWEGVYSFNHDGTGTFKAIYRVVERPSFFWPLAPPAPKGNDIPDAAAADISWNFTYTMSETGRITFTYEKGTYLGVWRYGPQTGGELYLKVTGPYYGVLSPNGKNIIVTWGVPLQLVVTADKENEIPLFSVICNAVQQGFRCDGKCPELVY